MIYTKTFASLILAFPFISGAQAFAAGSQLSDLLKAQDSLPTGVCIFDLDDTLIKKTQDNPSTYTATSEAQQVINLCIQKGFGIALATASDKYRIKDKLGNLNFGKYNDIINNTDNIMNYNYTEVRKMDPAQNPIYIVHATGSNFFNITSNKAQSMDRIMRSYFGMGTGGSFVDDKNLWLSKYKADNSKLPSDVDVSGCLVLFDDEPANIASISNYNKVFGTKFGAIQVDKTKTLGVTIEDAEKGIDHITKNCKL
jgi:hypothetical protein